MGSETTLEMFERDTTVTPYQLRQAGYVPATFYAKGQDSQSIQVKAHEFEVAYFHGARQFTLKGMGKTLQVKVKQLQMQNIRKQVTHIEFGSAN